MALVAGTGSVAYGRNAAGKTARAGGWGYLAGDEGSAYWIGREALAALALALDGRGPPTALLTMLLRSGVQAIGRSGRIGPIGPEHPNA